MRNDIPSLAVLQAFEAAARLGSFARAGAELALTPSAISRHVAALEARLGVALFVRVRQRLALTDTGRAYAARMRQHLEQIERDTQAIRNGQAQGYALHLAVVSTFATQWLIPRLPDFAQAHPRVTVHLAVRSEPFAFEHSSFDAAITYGDHRWPGTQALPIVEEGDSVPLCSPTYAQQHALGGPDANWEGCTHIGLYSRPHAWQDWYDHVGRVMPLHVSRGPRYELYSMMLAAATAGLGIALVPRLLAQPALESGQLIPAHPQPLPGNQRYWFTYPEHRPASPALSALRDWLVSEPIVTSAPA